MPAADIHSPEKRDEMPPEIRSVPKQVIKKSEPLQTAQAAGSYEPAPTRGREGREINMQQTDAKSCMQEGLADRS